VNKKVFLGEENEWLAIFAKEQLQKNISIILFLAIDTCH
jgi:hypothetical protein